MIKGWLYFTQPCATTRIFAWFFVNFTIELQTLLFGWVTGMNSSCCTGPHMWRSSLDHIQKPLVFLRKSRAGNLISILHLKWGPKWVSIFPTFFVITSPKITLGRRLTPRWNQKRQLSNILYLSCDLKDLSKMAWTPYSYELAIPWMGALLR